MYSGIISFIRETFRQPEGFIPLHAPWFGGNEQQYVADAINSTYVSSVGAYVNRFEELLASVTGARFAVATTNGTSALHLALVAAGVGQGHEVITQPLTFVATANAIAYTGAAPLFLDVDRDTLGLSPAALKDFLSAHTTMEEGRCIHKANGKRIMACIPMHSFGFPSRVDELAAICAEHGITLIEDCAESLGSHYKDRHTGNYGLMGTFSFNGNKTVTCGGGGAIITNDEVLAHRLKHLSTTAKLPHAWEFSHDEVGYNYRMPNLNAALACAQLEQLSLILVNKAELAALYAAFFSDEGMSMVQPIQGAEASNWLNTLILPDRKQRDQFLSDTNNAGVMTRPAWTLLNKLPMYAHCQHDALTNARWLEERLANIPSSFRPFAAAGSSLRHAASAQVSH